MLERKGDDIICDKGGEKTQGSRDDLLSKWCGENCTDTCKRMELLTEQYLTPHTEMNSNAFST